jgi:hypothetical protein
MFLVVPFFVIDSHANFCFFVKKILTKKTGRGPSFHTIYFDNLVLQLCKLQFSCGISVGAMSTLFLQQERTLELGAVSSKGTPHVNQPEATAAAILVDQATNSPSKPTSHHWYHLHRFFPKLDEHQSQWIPNAGSCARDVLGRY